MNQVEIQLTYPPASGVRVASAIAKFAPDKIRESQKMMKNGSFPKRSRITPGRPGKHPGTPRSHFQTKLQLKNANLAKFKNRVFWPSGPSPGASGASRKPLDLPSRAASLVSRSFRWLFDMVRSTILQLLLHGGHKWLGRDL